MDSVTWHVLDAMADDWESIDQIRPHVHHYSQAVSDDAIFQVLHTLHDRDLIQIMDGDGHGTGEFPSDPVQCWFSMTDRGRTLWDIEGQKYRDE